MDSSLLKFWPRLQSLLMVFRFVELCILFASFSWLSIRLPFAVKISSEYFRKLVSLIFSHIAIFFLGNAIVVTLLAKSGLLSGKSPPSIDNAVADFNKLVSENSDDIPVLVKEEVIFQDKEIICKENKESTSSMAVVTEEKTRGKVFSDLEVKESYRRTQSENSRRESETEEKTTETLRRSETNVCRKNFTVEVKESYQRTQSEKSRRESETEEKTTETLRRSETNVSRKNFAGGGDEAAVATAEDFPADRMSDEEFNRTIEAFIARQVRFHRKERFSVVLHGQA